MVVAPSQGKFNWSNSVEKRCAPLVGVLFLTSPSWAITTGVHRQRAALSAHAQRAQYEHVPPFAGRTAAGKALQQRAARGILYEWEPEEYTRG